MRIRRLPNTDDIMAAVRANDGYCPCRRVKNEDTKCMCKEFREGGLGECHCGLYEKTEI